MPVSGDGTGGARDINNAGDIVGHSGVGGVRTPTVWRGGVPTLLPMLPGATAGEATLVSETGMIIGYSRFGFPLVRATLYTPSGDVVDIPTPANFSSEALDMNVWEDVVGSYNTGSFPPRRAFLYRNGSAVDLNTWLPANSGWELWRAFSIDDQGVILGLGRFNGTPRGFLLTPVPEPGTLLAGALLIATALARRRRRVSPSLPHLQGQRKRRSSAA
jgi:hypothetical protein